MSNKTQFAVTVADLHSTFVRLMAAKKEHPFARQKTCRVLPKVSIAVEMRLAGASQSVIGKRLGVTREWARQLLLIATANDPSLSSQLAGLDCRRVAATKPPKITGLFSAIVKRWLAAEGWRWCCFCKLFLCADDFSPGRTPRCKPCQVAITKDWAHNHPEKARELARRNNANEAKNGYPASKRWLEKITADPERNAARLARMQARYAARVAAPEFREELRRKERERYARRKARMAALAREEDE